MVVCEGNYTVQSQSKKLTMKNRQLLAPILVSPEIIQFCFNERNW